MSFAVGRVKLPVNPVPVTDVKSWSAVRWYSNHSLYVESKYEFALFEKLFVSVQVKVADWPEV